jgi:hypothetical protein
LWAVAEERAAPGEGVSLNLEALRASLSDAANILSELGRGSPADDCGDDEE